MDLQTQRLSNGVTVASVSLPGFRSAAIGAFVRVGSRYEPARLNGLSHFLEHMAFKGTATRTAWQLALAVERVGASMNAYTAKDHTAYHTVLLSEHMPLTLDILADVLIRPSLPQNEIDLERRVILQEQSEAADDPDALAHDALDQKAFPKQGLGQPILGTPRLVRSITREDFLDYLQRHYCGCNLIVTGVGAIDHTTFATEVARHFDALPLGTPESAAPARYQGGFRHIDAAYEQTVVSLAWPIPGRLDPNYPAYELLGDLLGAGMSSPLFQAIRERRGLAYHIESWTESYQDCGLLHINAGLAPRHLRVFFDVLCDELLQLTHQIADEDLERTHHQFAMHWARTLERPLDLAEIVARDLMMAGVVTPPEHHLQRLQSIDTKTLQATLNTVLSYTPTLVQVGPAGRGDHYAHLRRRIRI
jgi:predicted Zn-dependent peptidase